MNAFVKYGALYVIWYPLRNVVRLFTTRTGHYGRLLKIGDFLGAIFHRLFRPGREIIREELTRIGLYTPREEKLTFQHMMRIEMEGMVFEDLNRDLIRQITCFRGLPYLDRSIARGKGTVLVLFHFGWNMHTIPALGHMGYKIRQVADTRPVDRGATTNWFHREVIERRLANGRSLPVDFVGAASFLRPVVRALQENSTLILAIDGREASNFNVYPFLGQRIRISPVILKTAIKLDATVIPMITYRGRDGRHRVILHRPLEMKDPDIMVQALLDNLARYVRKMPHQYAHYLFTNALANRDPRRNLEPLFES